MIEMEPTTEKELSVHISSLYRGDKLLIKDSELFLSQGDKVAIIGRNGSGKSTLLETIYSSSRNTPLDDSIELDGEIEILENIRVGYLEQDVRLEFDGNVKEYIDNQVGKRADIYNRYQFLTEKASTEKQHQQEYTEILSLMDTYSLWEYEREIEVVFSGLNIPMAFLNRDIKSLSGGEATKISLASLLVSKPDLILLDEPTNNLDLDNIRFVEDWFKKTNTSCIVVSHDRQFLNNIINTIWEIDEESNIIYKYGGNYSEYEKENERQFEGRIRDYEEQQRTKYRLESDIKRLHTQAKRFEGISKDDFYRAKGAKIAKSAKARETRVQRELNKLGEPQKPKLPKFVLREAPEEKGTIVNINNLNFRYDDTPLIEDLSLKLESGDRLSISGPNGSGKTTLLRIINGQIKSENIYKRENLKVGYIPQSIIPKNPQQDILSYMREHVIMGEDELIDTLGKVLFANPIHLKVKDFSIGELKRIQFALIFASSPNFLILDEPTNHLDIHTLNMLERTLKQYKHTLLVVSHDREFLKRIGVKKNITLK